MVEALAQLAVDERAGRAEQADIRLGPYTAYCLISVLQLAWRHPMLSDHHKSVIEQIARPLQSMFGPPLSASIEMGWQVEFDVCSNCKEAECFGDCVRGGGEPL